MQWQADRGSFPLSVRTGLVFPKIYFYVPAAWSLLLVNATVATRAHPLTNLYLFSETYFFKIPTAAEHILMYYDNATRILSLQYRFITAFFGVFWKWCGWVFRAFSSVFFRKLKLRGKGYYIYKNIRNTIAPQLGYSHMTRFYAYAVFVKFTAKTTVLLFGVNKRTVDNRGTCLFFFKPINLFTGRGLRFSRQVVYRKTGKVSSYR